MGGDAGRAELRLDLLFYAFGGVFALVTAVLSEFYGYRVWGNFAVSGYFAAAALTLLRPTQRWLPVVVSGVLSIVAPLLYLAFRRAPDFTWGPWPWSFPAQPEVWVIERAARLLLADGTPYTDLATLGRTAHPDDYTPYGPAMSVFGLPRAVFGDHPLTDSRVMFLLGSALAVWAAWRVLGKPTISVRGAQLAAISPLTALTLSVAGDDVAIVAMIVLAAALAYRVSPVWTGAVCAVMVAMKLTAIPAAVVIGFGVLAHAGGRALSRYLGALASVGALITVPVLAADPASFVEHVIKFPVGLGQASSPASSPLPGHLIAGTGPVGHVIALVLLGIAACAITAWLVVRPPRSGTEVLVRVAVGLGAAILLAPATRWGYLVYPVALAGAAIAFAAITATPGPASQRDPGPDSATDHPAGPSAGTTPNPSGLS
ncbi:glycosyltransferase family 87 protein [Alloactinosynnema sp. L-07]|uniref:glycosyltransferase family 87 protein n=1 Tax=Alloactinosynnema sp. L-07 TaxID=1653480 RepID=UPI0009ECEC69|nr:glycosyltransferase family 87 protein [Alloactinosynnema sp. L-07]